MDTKSKEEPVPEINRPDKINFIVRLLNSKAKKGLWSIHLPIITVLLFILAYIYYGLLDSYHDIYVILFFYPLMYAAIVYRVRGVIVTGLIFLAIVLPYAFFLANDPYSLTRTLLFALFAFVISGLEATLLNYLEHQVESYSKIVSLNEELNSYIERLQSTQKQLVQSEKINAIGQLSASVAHELNNPLAGILIYVKLLEKKINGNNFEKQEFLDDLNKIEYAVTHSSNIVKSLLDFARQSEPLLKPVHTMEIINKAVTLVDHQAEMKGVVLHVEENEQLPEVMADSGQILQVFVNLCLNAIQATSKDGTLTIAYRKRIWINCLPRFSQPNKR